MTSVSITCDVHDTTLVDSAGGQHEFRCCRCGRVLRPFCSFSSVRRQLFPCGQPDSANRRKVLAEEKQERQRAAEYYFSRRLTTFIIDDADR